MSPRVRNRIGWWDRLAALQGTAVELDVPLNVEVGTGGNWMDVKK